MGKIPNIDDLSARKKQLYRQHGHYARIIHEALDILAKSKSKPVQAAAKRILIEINPRWSLHDLSDRKGWGDVCEDVATIIQICEDS